MVHKFVVTHLSGVLEAYNYATLDFFKCAI